MVTLSVRGTGAVRIGGPPPQRRVVLKWFYSLSRRNTFVGGTCAPPSSLLFVVLRSTNSKSGAKRHPQHLRRPANRNSLLKTITWAKTLSAWQSQISRLLPSPKTVLHTYL